jgi:RNA polymerase sigma-70 factor (ECF subfamily)
VERALRTISVEHQAALVLTYYLDLSLAEAAATLGIPIGTMKSRLDRARSALRAALSAEDRVVLAGKERVA